MARSKSAVLSAADKRAVVKDMKDRLKALVNAGKNLNRERNLAEKTHAKFIVANDKEAAKVAKATAKLTKEISLVSGK